MTNGPHEFRSFLSGAHPRSHEAEIGFTAGACTLFMAVLAVPYAKYVFLVYFALLLTMILRTMLLTGEGKRTLTVYVRLFWPILLVAATFVAAFARTATIPPGLAKEALAVVIVLLFGLLFLRVLRTTDDVTRFQEVLTRQMSYLGAVIVALCLVKFILVLNDIRFGPLMTAPGGRYPMGSSLLKDYNYFALVLLISFLSIIDMLRRSPSGSSTRANQFLLALITLTVLFTSSRRGIVILLALNALMLGSIIFKWHAADFFSHILMPREMRWYALFLGLIGAVLIVIFTAGGVARDILIKGVGTDAPFVRYNIIVPLDAKGQMTLADTRSSRYNLAWEIYSVEYDVVRKIFGDGFAYIGRYADSFRLRNELGSGGPVDYDYPHNPLLSALLAGGLIGFAALLYFFGKSAWVCIRTWPRLSFFAVSLVVLLLFGLFSGNTIFSTPWFLMVAFIPTIAHHLNDSEDASTRHIMPSCATKGSSSCQ